MNAKRDMLSKRYEDMRDDKLDLYNLKPDGKMSWGGHIQQFLDWQRGLEKFLRTI